MSTPAAKKYDGDLVRAFIANCHALVQLAYARMKPEAWTASEEEDITGELVAAMSEVIQDQDAPVWCDHLVPCEEVRQRRVGIHGKRRPRIDIEILLAVRGDRPRYRIEAKRLYSPYDVSTYLGTTGIGRFLSGYYSCPLGEAGMIGYAQAPDQRRWASAIKAAICAKAKALYTPTPATFQPLEGLVMKGPPVFVSVHRVPVGDLRIAHTILRFH